MISVALGSAVLAVLGFYFVKKPEVQLFLKKFWVMFKYNTLAIKYVLEDLLQVRYNKTELPKLSERVAIVTGGSRGIGVEIVKMLLKCDMEVVIACRKVSAGEATVESIRRSGIISGKTNVIELDNSSLDSVKKFIKNFTNNYTKLDILINNAGIMFLPYNETKDGFEEQYGVNYLSHFLLTVSLLPQLKKAGTPEHFSRIVNVSSCAHILGKINFDDVNQKETFVTGLAYAQSKLAQIMFTKYLARFFEKNNLPITASAVHPGLVNTDLFSQSFLSYARTFCYYIFKTPEGGATPIVYAAVSPLMEKKSGLYISNCLEASVIPSANDILLQDKLFDLSLKQVNLQHITL